MKRKTLLAVAIMAGISTAAFAQKTVTFTEELDVATDNAGSVYAACYSVAANKFLGSSAGSVIRIYNGDTGAYESDLDITGTNPSGLGFFAIGAGSDGSIFGYEDSGTTLWQWADISSAPASAATGVTFARVIHVVGSGNSTNVALTGDADNGPIEIYGTTDDSAYTLDDTVPASEIDAKSGFAINDAVDEAWAVGDVGGQPITKAVKSGGSWAAETTTWAPTIDDAGSPVEYLEGGGPMAYDNVNDILFVLPMPQQTTIVYALDGTTGEELGNATVDTATNTTSGYNGAYVSVSGSSGTLWMTCRGDNAEDLAMYKFSYSVSANVNDWSLY